MVAALHINWLGYQACAVKCLSGWVGPPLSGRTPWPTQVLRLLKPTEHSNSGGCHPGLSAKPSVPGADQRQEVKAARSSSSRT